MSTPTNIPETPMGETEQYSYFKSKKKFQQQLQDIFQTSLRLTRPDQFDQLCQWMKYNQYHTIDDFYESPYNDPEKFDINGPATEYKWKGKMNYLCANAAQKLKSFVRWMTHEDRPYELHDDSLATLTRDNYLKFRHMHSQSFSASSPSHPEPSKLKTSFSGESKHQTPSESQTALNNYKKGPQRKAFFSQQEEFSDDDEYANAEEQFSTDPEPEEHSPYSVYQSSFHPKMPQKSFLPPNIWETPPESTKQMIIEHNMKVKLNNPTPYPSGSKIKPNPTLGKPTPPPQQVHQHSQDEPTEEPTPDTSTQTLVHKCLAESDIDPTDIQNVMPVSYAKRNISPHESSRQIQPHQRYVFARVNQSKHHNCHDWDPTDTPSAVPTALQAPSDDTYNPKCTHSLMETQCNHSQYPILMKQNCPHNPSTRQVSKSYHPNPVTFPYPPDPGEHVLETSSAPTTLVERDKLDLSSLTPPKGEMESPFSWTCPFKSPTSSTLCFGEPTLGKLNQETDFYMTKHMPKPSSGANRVSVSHSSLVTKNGSISMGRTSNMFFPNHGSTSRRLTGETNSSSTTLHMDTCSWKLTGEANSTTPHVDILWLTGKVMEHTLLDTRPQKLIGVVMTLMDLITLHPCPSSILMTYWGEPSSYLWMRMGRERGLPFLSMSRISFNNKYSSSRLMETNLMTSFHITNLWNT